MWLGMGMRLKVGMRVWDRHYNGARDGREHRARITHRGGHWECPGVDDVQYMVSKIFL